MVDPLGFKPAIADRRLTPVAAVERVQASQPVVEKAASTAAAETSSLQAAAKAMAATPPVDAERVARIRRAVQNGTFPLVPSTIADRLLALKMDWNPNDAS